MTSGCIGQVYFCFFSCSLLVLVLVRGDRGRARAMAGVNRPYLRGDVCRERAVIATSRISLFTDLEIPFSHFVWL